MNDAPSGSLRINLSLVLAGFALLAAGYNGGNNFFKAGQAVQLFDSRVATIEARLEQGEDDWSQRRTENAANMSQMNTRITANETDTRAAGNLGDRNREAIAALAARQEQFGDVLNKLADAIADLALKSGVQTEILKRVESRLADELPPPESKR